MPLCDKAGIISNMPLVSLKYLGGGELYSLCSTKKSICSLLFSFHFSWVSLYIIQWVSTYHENLSHGIATVEVKESLIS